MKIYGEEISDAKIVQKINGSLDKRFNTMSTIIVESKDVTKLSVTELMSSLLAHEHKFSKSDSGTSSESAFPSKHQQKSSINKGNNRKNQGAPRTDKKDKEQPQSKGKFPPCGICNKTNHLEKDCYHKAQVQSLQKIRPFGEGLLAQTKALPVQTLVFPMKRKILCFMHVRRWALAAARKGG